MTSKSPPLPPDLDLSKLDYMPLIIGRLLRSRSWLRAKKQPELGFYMINLWCRAWGEIPAASLENDDDVLCDAAMCPPNHWPNVKTLVMGGFEAFNDGRVYHKTLVEQALIALKKRLEWKEKKRNQRSVPRDTTGTINGHGRETPLSLTSYVDVEIETDKTETASPCSAAVPRDKGGKKRGTRIPDDWAPSDVDSAFALQRGFSVEQISEAADEFTAFWRSRSAQATKLDWSLTFQNRIREIERQSKRWHSNGFSLPQKEDPMIEARRIVEQRRRDRGEIV